MGCSYPQVTDGSLLEGYVHFGITAGSRGIHSGYDLFNIAAQRGPLLIADNHERDSPGFQVLLHRAFGRGAALVVRQGFAPQIRSQQPPVRGTNETTP